MIFVHVFEEYDTMYQWPIVSWDIALYIAKLNNLYTFIHKLYNIYQL